MRPVVAHGGRATSGSSDDDPSCRQGRGARGDTTADRASVEGMAARVSALAAHAERGGAGRAAAPRFDAGAGPRDSFAAVIDGLSAELDLPRAELVRELVDEMRRQIATDRAVLDYLLGIAESERHAE